jgi:hypothetical protein
MLTNNDFYLKINNFRVILNCFYIYFISNAFQHAKYVIFQYQNTYSIIYIFTRTLVSAFCILFISSLILYSLWIERVGLLTISTLLFIIFLTIRWMFDLYGYSSGYLKNSLYPPFEFFENDYKQFSEEITDFSFELMINILGIILTLFIIIRMRRKRTAFETFRMDVFRRMTV